MKKINKLKILHISEAYGWSGGANQALSLAKKLNEKGHINYIASPENGDLFIKAKQNSIETINFNPKSKSAVIDGFKLAKIIDEIGFDIIHAHHPKAHNAAVVAKIFSKSKPLLFVSRRVTHQLPSNIFAKFKYKTKNVNAYIAVCKYVANMLIDYGIEKERVFVVYSGVDKTKFFKREKDIEFKKSLGIDENETVITLIGNFSYDKGQHILIEALSILEKKGYRFSVIFAGRNTDTFQIKEMFFSKISKNKGIFLGLRNDVDKILNITDISINAAIKGEALSGSIRESLAMGVPSIASNIGGNSEIIKNGENGFLFTPGNFIELSQKIEKILNDKELREKFSENAIKTINENFTIDTMVQKTFEIYMKFLNIDRSS
jgi:glycosyltransferase involved in cell wall biosynthesis